MSVIKAKCTDQQLKLIEIPVIASGGVNEIRAEFEFCEKWDGFAKTAIFYKEETDIYYSLLDSNDTCVVPWEVCYTDGAFKISVFGNKGDARRTSTTVRCKVRKGAMTDNTIPSNPTPDIYDQILADLARSRVIAPVGGFFSLSVDGDGNLFAYCEDDSVPEFEYDPETGNLYVVQEES